MSVSERFEAQDLYTAVCFLWNEYESLILKLMNFELVFCVTILII